MPVVAAGELQQQRTAGGRPSEPQRGHGRLRSTVDEPDHLYARHHANDAFRQFHLGLRRGAVRCSLVELQLQRRRYHGMGMAEDEGAPAQNVVHVAATLGVVQVGALAPLHEERLTSHCAERAYGRVHPSGDQGLRPSPQSIRSPHYPFPTGAQPLIRFPPHARSGRTPLHRRFPP